MSPPSVVDCLKREDMSHMRYMSPVEFIADISDMSSVLRVPRRIEVILMDEYIEGLLEDCYICSNFIGGACSSFIWLGASKSLVAVQSARCA